MSSLQGRTMFISGASRGIGLAIALRAAKDGANIAIAAKTTTPHAKLEGTIYSAAEAIEKAGGKALPLMCDIRSEEAVYDAVRATVEKFGGIDICVNNASAIQLTGTLDTPMKRFDLMNQVNARGTYLVSQACLPHLLKSKFTPHILALSPPISSIKEKWFETHVAYSMAKFGMSMCVLGMAGEFKGKVAVNALWPRTTIATAAVNMLGGEDLMRASRKADIMADAAYAIFTKGLEFTGNFCIDDEVVRAAGVTDLKAYNVDPDVEPTPDFFVD
ncbi:MAG: short chain dehydrogenase [Archangium gephyra]|uniref:Short chain dehydrogenase n=1 Tax=Archangium gephyra TaxID=48 RepID=A0A2W5VRR8_9BACT|nr:MAG: short chain dehydrogenase [Archangium gephyra]